MNRIQGTIQAAVMFTMFSIIILLTIGVMI